MKNHLFLIILLSALLSCNKENASKTKSTACFDYSPQTGLAADVEISFSNCSESAVGYFWDFGDGSTSLLKTPTHKYAASGSYKVTLVSQNAEFKDLNADGLINFQDATSTYDIEVKTLVIP